MYILHLSLYLSLYIYIYIYIASLEVFIISFKDFCWEQMLKKHSDVFFFLSFTMLLLLFMLFIVAVILFLESGAHLLCHYPTTVMSGW